jgi:translocation protein SEC62
MEHQAKAPPEVQKVAQFLRGGNSGIKTRVGAVNGKRLDYFKGSLVRLFGCCFAPTEKLIA